MYKGQRVQGFPKQSDRPTQLGAPIHLTDLIILPKTPHGKNGLEIFTIYRPLLSMLNRVHNSQLMVPMVMLGQHNSRLTVWTCMLVCCNDNDKNELQKVWTMEMQTNDGNISMSMTNEQEQVSEEDKKFLYARAVHSNHSIQYHMQQIIK